MKRTVEKPTFGANALAGLGFVLRWSVGLAARLRTRVNDYFGRITTLVGKCPAHRHGELVAVGFAQANSERWVGVGGTQEHLEIVAIE